MTSKSAELVEIGCLPGVQPASDSTAFKTPHYAFADKIRFTDGMPEKIGGWQSVNFDYSATIDGTARSVNSANVDGRIYTLVGTNSKLYSQIASLLTNITPLLTTTTAIANSIATHYATLANNPITTSNGSIVVTIADTEAIKFQINDTVTLSGATGVGGVLAAALNTVHVIRSVSAGSYTIRVATAATSTATGGGAAVLRRSGLLTFTAAAHGQLDGDRVKIAGAANTGGILAADINNEFIIRNVTAGTFDVMTDGVATSSVASGGGAATTYQKEIPDGLVDENFGQGYGMGLYGVGLYGVSKLSTSIRKYPRIWYFDRFGELFTMTPGNGTGLYKWDGDNNIAPTLVSGAPTDINYQFVSNSICVTFGAGGVQNKIFSCDQGALTQWVASSTNQVFEDNVEGAGRLVSHVNVNGTNLIFTENQTYTFRYIGLPNIWDIELKEANIGIIGSMARVTIGGVAYWMDDKNFYQWSGGNVEIIPSNSQGRSTIHQHVFGDLNASQKSKIFAWFNKDFSEIWWHYLSQASNEPDRIARFNIIDKTWVPDTMDRTAAEYPNISLINPRLMNVGTMYKHEVGYDADGVAMPFSLVTNKRTLGRQTANQDGVIPDSIQTGNITYTVQGFQFPQSTAMTANMSYTVTPTTERIPMTLNGRYWQDSWSGAELGQKWQMGKWQEYIQPGAGN